MKQAEIWQAQLDQATGSEQAGCRPVVIISGDLLNEVLPIAIICPLTRQLKPYKGSVMLKLPKQNGLRQSQ